MIKSIVLQEGKQEEAILKLIAFFDLFDFPLTLKEANFYLHILSRDGNIFLLSDTLLKLDNLIKEGRLDLADGFYFLPGREAITAVRRKRYNYSLRKLKIAKRFVRLFSVFPFVRRVALANSIGFYNLRDESDIDFFVVTARNKIFLSRLFCTGLAKILNKRPNAKTKRDKICLSFYISEDGPKLDDLKLADGDPYFDFWEVGLHFLLDKKNNGESSFLCCGWLEKIAKKLQFWIMPKKLRESAMPAGSNDRGDFGVVIGHDILKMYLSDRRLEIKKKYETKLGEIL